MNGGSSWPLAGMRVVDLSTEIAGPYCTKMLVDAGADVVKIEPPGGDPLGQWSASGTSVPAGSEGALFQHLNAGKRSVVADIATAAGRQIVRDLVATADLAVGSFAPGTLARAGLTLNALQARRPQLSLIDVGGAVCLLLLGRHGSGCHQGGIHPASGRHAARERRPSRAGLGVGSRLCRCESGKARHYAQSHLRGGRGVAQTADRERGRGDGGVRGTRGGTIGGIDAQLLRDNRGKVGRRRKREKRCPKTGARVVGAAGLDVHIGVQHGSGDLPTDLRFDPTRNVRLFLPDLPFRLLCGSLVRRPKLLIVNPSPPWPARLRTGALGSRRGS